MSDAGCFRLAVLAAVVFVGCADPTQAPSGGSGGNDHCATSPPAATSGGDWGPGWPEQQADDTAGIEPPKFDVPGLMESNPTVWEHETASGLYYRSPTNVEMADYGWTSSTLLVIMEESFVDDVVSSKNVATIQLPVHDYAQLRPQENLTIEQVTLTQQWATDALPYRRIVRNASGSTVEETLHPNITYYLPAQIDIDDIPDYVVGVVSSSRGGLSAFGGGPYERFHLRGPYTHTKWFDLEIAPPGGSPFFVLETVHDDGLSAMTLGSSSGFSQFIARQSRRGGMADFTAEMDSSSSVTLSGTCDDNLDNDPDCLADEDDYNCMEHTDYGGHLYPSVAQWEQSKDFALFGDMSFCSPCDGVGDDCSPETELMEYSITATSILNSVTPIPAYQPDVRVPPFRMTMYGCLAIYNEVEQDDCDYSKSCELTDYPLVNTEDNYSLKLAQVWPLIDFAVGTMASADRHPVHIAGLVTNIVAGSGAEAGGAGAAYLWAPDRPDRNGAFLVRRSDAGVHLGAGRSIAHEIGHTLGLADDDLGEGSTCEGDPGGVNEYPCTMVWALDGLPKLGFMRQGIGFAPTLDWDDESAVGELTQGSVWKNFGPNKVVPRPSGFGWTDCNIAGHPGCGQGTACLPEGVCDYE